MVLLVWELYCYYKYLPLINTHRAGAGTRMRTQDLPIYEYFCCCDTEVGEYNFMEIVSDPSRDPRSTV